MTTQKERNLIAGFDFYQFGGGFLAFGMMICMPVSVTLEVFFRKNMGQRFFNGINFYAGMVVFAAYAIILNGFVAIGSSFSDESGASSFIFIVWLAYIAMGIYQFISQWWGDQVGNPIHSLSMGYPRLEPLARILMNFINVFLMIPVKIIGRFMPPNERSMMENTPVLTDSVSFTYRVIEPSLAVIFAFIMFFSGANVIGFWLLFGSVALAYQANTMLEMERHQALDIRDQLLEAAEMQAALRGESKFMRIPDTTKVALESVAKKVEDSPVILQNIKTFSPSIAEAVAALNPKLQNLGKE